MKNREIYCMNQISPVGTANFRKGYTLTDTPDNVAGFLVRSRDLHGMEFPKTLRAIARAGAGVNNIPLDVCAEQGIVVFNTPGANANAVKEMVLAGLLLSCRDLIGGEAWVRAHQEEAALAKLAEQEKKNFAGTELQGKSLGVIGLGAIGVLVANAAVALGMEVYGYDPFLSVNSAWKLSRNVRHAGLLTELYDHCDFLTVHVPATEKTRGMLNEEAFSRMKDGVRILNFARDILVELPAMEKALKSGKVAAYITDFPTAEVCALPNTLVFPHLGASTEEAEENCAVMAVREIQDYLDNGNIHHSVNFPEIDAGVCETPGRIAILHRNIPNMLGKLTGALGTADINIENLQNKSRGAYAYTLVDLDQSMTEQGFQELHRIDGVLRVRRVK